MKTWNKLADASVISRIGQKRDKKHVPLAVRKARRSGPCVVLYKIGQSADISNLTSKIGEAK
jgi:hypothetical protein